MLSMFLEYSPTTNVYTRSSAVAKYEKGAQLGRYIANSIRDVHDFIVLGFLVAI